MRALTVKGKHADLKSMRPEKQTGLMRKQSVRCYLFYLEASAEFDEVSIYFK